MSDPAERDRLPGVPDSPAAGRALETARAFSSAALVNHCVRSYLFAAAYGRDHGIGFDDEVLYVASMFHDLALTPAFDNHRLPFEVAGGHVAWVFAAGTGWSPARRDHTARIVVDHMRDEVTVEENAEGYLLALATALDISGRHPEDWSEQLTTAVVERYPRLDLATEFVRCFADQAARKPDSSAAAAVASGIAARVVANPLEEIARPGSDV